MRRTNRVQISCHRASRLKMAGRKYHWVYRVVWTLADLDGAETVRRPHVAEALSYRRVALGR